MSVMPMQFGMGAALLASMCLMGAVHAGSIPPMRTPMVYLIDYSKRFLDDDQNILAFRDCPPDLVHVGKSVPILHNWGPVPLICGENQYTGGPNHTLSWEAIRLLTPKELEDRIEMLKVYTKKWHDIGVPLLMPYSSYHTIAGDHEKREGFWKFYDHWNDYEKWLGPKPTEDPFQWLMVDKTGKFVPGACGGYSPEYFAPLHRYRVCPEHPEWKKFQIRLTEMIAEVGYDGVFPDNSSMGNNCFCTYCREGLKKYAKGLSPREMEILGVKGDPGDVDLMSPDTPAELIRRYRIDTVARYQRMVRDAGRKVNPKFQVFPNVNQYQSFMPISAQCDILMFESTYSPGCNFTGEPPEGSCVTLTVTDGDADASRDKFSLRVQNAETFVEMSAVIEFPKQVKRGAATELAATIETLGASNTDSDWGEAFEFVLTDSATGEETHVPLTPAITVGGGPMRPEAKRPPVTLKGQWTPSKAGRYKLSFAYKYTDEGHTDVAKELPCRHDLNLGAIYQTHIGQLLFTMHAGARTVLLDYEGTRTGREAVQELGLAECAAFSSGSTIASKGDPQKKYARFFRSAKHIYEGFEPLADIGLLYAYWCYNPGNMGLNPTQETSPSMDLAGRHRPIKVLMDRTVNSDDLATLKTLILCGHVLEMSDDQVAAVKAFAEKGGQLHVYRPGTTVNGKPFGEVLPDAKEWKPGMDVAGMKSLCDAKGFARGLRFSMFTKNDPRRMVLHVVNYNVPHREKAAKVTEVKDAVVALPVPDGWSIGSVKAHDPDREDVADLKFEVKDGRLTFALPPVRIYNVIEISGK